MNLTIEEINQIIDALSAKPYAQVFQLINKLALAAQQKGSES